MIPPTPPPGSASRQYDSSGTATESTISTIWCEVLELPSVGVQDNFFDLGGHSVLLHMVSERLGERFGSSPPVVDLFRYPTVHSLAQYLDGNLSGGSGNDPSAMSRESRRARLGRQRGQRTQRANRGDGRE